MPKAHSQQNNVLKSSNSTIPYPVNKLQWKLSVAQNLQPKRDVLLPLKCSSTSCSMQLPLASLAGGKTLSLRLDRTIHRASLHWKVSVCMAKPLNIVKNGWLASWLDSSPTCAQVASPGPFSVLKQAFLYIFLEVSLCPRLVALF